MCLGLADGYVELNRQAEKKRSLLRGAIQPNVRVTRHPKSGVAHLLSEKVDRALVNAGDGSHEHPTQPLLERPRKGRRRIAPFGPE
jgi:hypothetical protein